jgi:metallo-beta-lactamase family protein
MDLRFLGAAGTVTGSKYLGTTGAQRLLVDCGLFQGFKHLRLRNWARLPVDPRQIDAVILTHAPIDHSGYLPVLVKNGFAGPVYSSRATRDLCAILLPDSGRLQEEEAEYANAHGFSRHQPALPLYTQEDAERSLRLFYALDFDHDFDLGGDLTVRLSRAGHILGASCVWLQNDGTSLLFSGDLGRPHDPVMLPPVRARAADYLVLESTYGDRVHDASAPVQALGQVISRTVARGGVIVVPAFAVGRTQTLLYEIQRLQTLRAIPHVPVYLDSPMAIQVTRLFRGYRHEHRLSPADDEALSRVAHLVNSRDESKALLSKQGPMIIISASGMATGGRVLHHLKTFAPDPRNTILFVGYQAPGTRGWTLVHGAGTVKIHGGYVSVRAEVVLLDHFAAHADAEEILDWLKGFETPPRQTFLTHGEPAAADALRRCIEERLGWACRVAEYLEEVTLASPPAG